MQLPWYHGWNIIGFCIVFQAISFGTVFYSFAVMAIPLTQTYQLSLSQVMLATACLQVGIGLLSPLLGRALDLIRLRNLVMLGALALTGGFLLLAYQHTFKALLVVYALILPIGLVLAGSIAAQTAAARWFVRKRGFALGISAMGTSLGAFLFPPIVEQLISRLGLADTFMALGLLSALVIIPLAWLVLHREPGAEDLAQESQQQTAGEIANDRDWQIGEVLLHRPFWIIICGFTPVCAGFTAVQFNLGAYALDHGFASAQAAYLLSIQAVAMVAGKFFFAGFADRVDHRLLFWIMAAGQAVVLLALQFSPGYSALIAIISLFGFTMGGVLPLIAATLAAQFGVKAFGRIIGISMLFITASSAAGPYFSALAYDANGNFNTAFSIIACMLIPAALAMILLPGNRWGQPLLSIESVD